MRIGHSSYVETPTRSVGALPLEFRAFSLVESNDEQEHSFRERMFRPPPGGCSSLQAII